jgi:hypothetical protein
MKRPKAILFCLTGILAMSAILPAKASVLADNPYTSIAQRNVFGLQAFVLYHAPAPPVAPPPQIFLTGITTITLGVPEVLFKMQSVANPSKIEYYVLGEGETQDEVKVMQIDTKSELVVTFNNHGVIQKIPLKNGSAATSH